MRPFVFIFFILSCFLSSATTGSVNKSVSYSKNPHWAFEENKGQVTGADSAHVKYFYKQGNLTMFLTEKGIAYQFEKLHYPEEYSKFMHSKFNHDLDSLTYYQKKIKSETYRMDIELVGANINCEIIAEDKSTDYIQYYNHNALDVHAYQKITYKNIYPHIDWVVYINNKEISIKNHDAKFVKYDFIVHPGGNPQNIQLKTKWVEDLNLNEDGSIELKSRMGCINEAKPISFQDNLEVITKFKLEEETFRFEVSNYDLTKDLRIDPSVTWSTYYGGSDIEYASNVCNDNLGNIYISGTTASNTSIANGGYKNSYGGNQDAFLVKFNSDGLRLWATYYGGSNFEFVGLDSRIGNGGCSVDSSNNIYLVGLTNSSTNIAFNGFENTYTGTAFLGSSFIVKFDANGQRIWGTYFNGLFYSSCAVDKKNNFLYLLSTSSLTNRSTSGVHQTFIRGGKDAVLSKFDLNGNRIWTTYFGGQKREVPFFIATDNNGSIYITGETNSNDNISYNGFQDTFIGCTSNCRFNHSSDSSDIFLAKFNTNGTLVWSTYYGGSGFESLSFCTTDNSGNVFLGGLTVSPDRIAINGYRNYSSIYQESPFLVKFNSSGMRIWGTYYGDTLSYMSSIVSFNSSICDNQGNIYVAGQSLPYDTTSYTSTGFQTTYSGTRDGLIVKFNPNGNREWGTLWGGNESEDLTSISIFNNHLYVFGYTYSDSLYSSYSGSTNLGYKGHKMNYSGNRDDILAKICLIIDTPKITISSNRGTDICGSTVVKFTAVDTFEGLYPHYFWKKNGSSIGTDTNVLTTSIANNDTISCLLKSSASCLAFDSSWSNKLVMKIKSADSTFLNITTCSNQPYFFNGLNRLTSGQYRDTLTSSSGCDSFIFLNLTVNQTSTTPLTITTTCSSPSYFFKGQNRTTTGIYRDTLKNILGCDSFVILDLIVKSHSSSSLIKSICPGQSYLFDGVQRTTSGTYTRTIPNASGCDSTITLTLTVLTTPSTQTNTVWGCTPFVFNGKTYFANAVVKDTVKSSFGCDSVVISTNLNLKPTPTTLPPIEHIFCDSVIYKGQKYTTSFTIIDTFRTSANIVCDSAYQPIKYTIKHTPQVTISPRQIDTLYKGESRVFIAKSAKNYLWSTGETSSQITVPVTQTQAIYLTVWDDMECRDTLAIYLTALDPTILDIPTGFSPLGTHIENRTFRPNINGRVERILFDVYNRLGEKVYSSSDPNMSGWDGRYKGENAPAGVYSYILEYQTNKRIYFKSGEVELVR